VPQRGPRPATVCRRALVWPVVLGTQIVIVAASPLLFLVAGLISIARRSSRPWRSVALVVSFAIIELRTVGALLRGTTDLDALLAKTLQDSHMAMRRILAVPLAIEPLSASVADVGDSDGLIVLARHCGPGDSIYVAWLLAVHYRLSLRVVLKSLLRLEPAIDLAGDDLPFCFVGRDPLAATTGISELAATLSKGDALLLFPEGGNFTWDRWRSGIRYLAAHGNRAELRRAMNRTHTLPPRATGAVTALMAAPQSDVLLIAHSGFGDDGRDRTWWRVPTHRDFLIRTILYPAAEVPRQEDDAHDFLDTAWSQVDTWVEAFADLNTPAEPLEPPPQVDLTD
jgi:1-acyl-sn-glycerol-3-phosphate acyltransferase